MDGTKEFIARRGEFAVMIGLAVEGEARLVLCTSRQRTSSITRPRAVAHTFRKRERRGGSGLCDGRSFPGDDGSSRSHLSGATESIRKKLGIEQTLQTGSIGLKVGLICESLAEVYVQGRGTSLWDTCGPEAILHAAGGRMSDGLGGALRYNSTDTRNLLGVIATNAVVHDKVVETVRAVREGGIP